MEEKLLFGIFSKQREFNVRPKMIIMNFDTFKSLVREIDDTYGVMNYINVDKPKYRGIDIFISEGVIGDDIIVGI